MIRKPAADWGRQNDATVAAVAAVRASVDVAKGGARVARAGGNVLRGIICWFFAAIWGFAALAGGLAMGSLPTLIGVGAMAAFMAWAGRRAFRSARRTIGGTPAA
jgi:hypothetical protein